MLHVEIVFRVFCQNGPGVWSKEGRTYKENISIRGIVIDPGVRTARSAVNSIRFGARNMNGYLIDVVTTACRCTAAQRIDVPYGNRRSIVVFAYVFGEKEPTRP